MSSNFESAFAYTVGNEGGYSNNPADAGGPTKYGITQADLSAYLGRAATVEEVKDMALETAQEIYEKNYWEALGCTGISDAGIATAMFDIGVVRGIGIPPLYAQRICNNHGSDLDVDGIVGPKTLSAINSLSRQEFITDFSAAAEEGFREIVERNPTQAVFLQGWVSRAHRLLSLI